MDQLRRQAQHALAARSSPARSRRAPRAHPLHDPLEPARRRGRRDRARVPRRPRRATPAPERGEEYLTPTLATDDGASRLGEIGIGTNFGIDRPVGAILFDEKIGGTVHLAVGRSYPETGGTNESAVHWDMICDLRRGGTCTPTASRSARRPLPRVSRVLFVTHPEAHEDPAVAVTEWALTERGRERMRLFAEGPEVREVRSVWSSRDRKAAEADALLAAESG